MRVPTVKLKNKESGQSIIVNESDYHELDGTIEPKWKGWAPVGFNQLTDIDVKANKAEAEAKKKEAAAVEKLAGRINPQMSRIGRITTHAPCMKSCNLSLRWARKRET